MNDLWWSEAATGGLWKSSSSKFRKFHRKTQAFSPAFLLKKTPIQVISCKICKIFKKNYFEEHLRTTASGGGSSGDFQEK